MDEMALRQQISLAARQLWMKGLIVADSGAVTAEVHRRRYVVTPPGMRRCDLPEKSLSICDIGGVELNGSPSLSDEAWRPHRIAYQVGLERQAEANTPVTAPPIGATVLATPPMTLALLRRTRASNELRLPNLPSVITVDAPDDAALRRALQRSNVVALPDERGLLCAASDVWAAVNLVERIEHAATIELACRYEP